MLLGGKSTEICSKYKTKLTNWGICDLQLQNWSLYFSAQTNNNKGTSAFPNNGPSDLNVTQQEKEIILSLVDNMISRDIEFDVLPNPNQVSKRVQKRMKKKRCLKNAKKKKPKTNEYPSYGYSDCNLSDEERTNRVFKQVNKDLASTISDFLDSDSVQVVAFLVQLCFKLSQKSINYVDFGAFLVSHQKLLRGKACTVIPAMIRVLDRNKNDSKHNENLGIFDFSDMDFESERAELSEALKSENPYPQGHFVRVALTNEPKTDLKSDSITRLKSLFEDFIKDKNKCPIGAEDGDRKSYTFGGTVKIMMENISLIVQSKHAKLLVQLIATILTIMVPQRLVKYFVGDNFGDYVCKVAKGLGGLSLIDVFCESVKLVINYFENASSADFNLLDFFFEAGLTDDLAKNRILTRVSEHLKATKMEYGYTVTTLKQDLKEQIAKFRGKYKRNYPALSVTEMDRLDKCVSRIVEYEKRAGIKVAPFSVLVYGSAGVGKTSVVENLKPVLSNAMQCESNTMCVVNPSATFQDGYLGQQIVLLDDIGQDISETGSYVNAVIDIVNNVRNGVNKADLAEKGFYHWDARVVFATTNVKDLNATAYAACPYAIHRRFKYVVTVNVKDQYREGLALNPTAVYAEESNVGKKVDPWVFTLEKVYSAPNTSRNANNSNEKTCYENILENVGFKELEAKLAALAREHNELQTQLVECATEVVLCDNCGFNSNFCDCNDGVDASNDTVAEVDGYNKIVFGAFEFDEVPPVTFNQTAKDLSETSYLSWTSYLGCLFAGTLATYGAFSFCGKNIPNSDLFAKTYVWNKELKLLLTFLKLAFSCLYLFFNVFVRGFAYILLYLTLIPIGWCYDDSMFADRMCSRICTYMAGVMFHVHCFTFRLYAGHFISWYTSCFAIRQLRRNSSACVMRRLGFSVCALTTTYALTKILRGFLSGDKVMHQTMFAGGDFVKPDPEEVKDPGAMRGESMWVTQEKPTRQLPERLRTATLKDTVNVIYKHIGRLVIPNKTSGVALRVAGQSWLTADHVIGSITAPASIYLGNNTNENAEVDGFVSMQKVVSDGEIDFFHRGNDICFFETRCSPGKDLRYLIDFETPLQNEQEVFVLGIDPRCQNSLKRVVLHGRMIGSRTSELYTDTGPTRTYGYTGALFEQNEALDHGISGSPVIDTNGMIVGVLGGARDCKHFMIFRPTHSELQNVKAVITYDLVSKARNASDPRYATSPPVDATIQGEYVKGQHPKSAFRGVHKPTPDAENGLAYIGKAPPRIRGVTPSSDVGPSLFEKNGLDLVAAVTKIDPSAGVEPYGRASQFRPETPSWETKNRVGHLLAKPKKLFPEGDIVYATEEYWSHVKPRVEKFKKWFQPDFKTESGHKPGILTFKENVNGIPGISGIDGMKLKTSAGYPYCTAKRNLVKGEIDAGVEQFTPEVMESIETIEERLAQGLPVDLFFRASLKDEPTPVKKMKTRVFYGSSIEATYLVRKYFLWLGFVILTDPIPFEMAVGLDFYKDWDRITKHIIAKGSDRCLDGDYGNFDATLPPDLLWAAWSIFLRMAEFYGYDDRSLTIMRNLVSELIHPKVEFFGDLLRLNGSNMSGHSMTVYINSFANSIMMRMSFHSKYARKLRFTEHVALITYGDDNVGSCTKEGELLPADVQTYLANYGIVYTDAAKTGVMNSLGNIGSKEFLKRGFVNRDGHWRAPLLMRSIFKSLLCDKSGEPSTQAQATFPNACIEIAMHGREKFEMYRPLLEKMAEVRTQDHEIDGLVGVALGSKIIGERTLREFVDYDTCFKIIEERREPTLC